MSSNIEITLKCIHCKRDFIAKTTKTRYCSKRCNATHYKRLQMDEKIIAARDRSRIPKEDRTWLSIPETAFALGVSERTIFRLMRKVKLIPIRIGRRVIIPKSEIIKFSKYVNQH